MIADTLDAVMAYIRRYVVLPADAADFLALWVAHTWAFEAAETTPYVRVVSPERQCGKTRLFECLETLCRRGWLTIDVTAAVLYRKGETEAPTLLFDEVDQMPFEDRRSVVSVLNAGYKISGRVWRCTDKGELMVFNCFYPKAIAGLDNGKVPDTVADRSVHVRLKRRRPDEPVAKFRTAAADAEAEPLRGALNAWATANLELLAHATPEMPDGLPDRQEEVWEPLLAIADLAGSSWPARARQAAQTLAGVEDDDDTVGVRLLTALRNLFAEQGDPERLPTLDIVTWLNIQEEAGWSSWNDRAGVKIHDLTRLLRRYGVRPEQRRPSRGGDPVRGVWRDTLQDPWARYAVGDPGNGGTAGTRGTSGTADHAGTGKTAGQGRPVPPAPPVPPNQGSLMDDPLEGVTEDE